MNVFDFAMTMEMDGKAYYEKLAAKTHLEGLVRIFSQLAEDEQRHYEIFQELKTKGKASTKPESEVLDQAKNVFSDLLADPSALKGVSGDLDAYQHAMQREEDSFRLYEKAAAGEGDPEVKALLLKIAAEEHKHFNILGNVYHFVNAPNQYLAWGEFSNLDEFHQFGRDEDI